MIRDMINISLDKEEEVIYKRIKEKIISNGKNWNQIVKKFILIGSMLDIDQLEDWQESALNEYRRQVDQHKLFSMSNLTFHSIEEYIKFGKFSYLIENGKKRED